MVTKNPGLAKVDAALSAEIRTNRLALSTSYVVRRITCNTADAMHLSAVVAEQTWLGGTDQNLLLRGLQLPALAGSGTAEEMLPAMLARQWRLMAF